MININDPKAKIRIVVSLNRQMLIFETDMAKDVADIIGKQYTAAAKAVSEFERDIDRAVNGYKKEMSGIFRKNYIRTSKYFGKLAIDAMDEEKKKSPMDDFEAQVMRDVDSHVAEEVVLVNRTTKNAIKKIVKKGFDEGLTNYEISKRILDLKEITEKYRSKMIARTETHGTANSALLNAMKTSRLIQEKEWVTVMDSRTRRGLFNHSKANGERVNINDEYFGTGEGLRCPGDFRGSVGNIINCRCGEMFHTRPAF